jgi:serine-type D-Ala-D-Ala endopeptidase (penicillin-binding protein 7)
MQRWKKKCALLASCSLLSFGVHAQGVEHSHRAAGAESARVAQSGAAIEIDGENREQSPIVFRNSGLSLRSSMALVVDQKTGRTLYAKNTDARAPIASITKLMTAMVVLDAKLPLDENIVIGNEDVDALRNTRSRLKVGTKLSRELALQLALMSSENRAASALAHHYPGGFPAFVEAMNRKASSLGMAHTHFVDSTGLNGDNVSTAQDLVRMVQEAYKYPLIREITTTGTYDVAMKATGRRMQFKNTNILVRNSSWQIGLSKTGYINEAGHCLVMQAEITKQPMIIVLLDSSGKLSRIADAQRIKKWMESSLTAGKRRYG